MAINAGFPAAGPSAIATTCTKRTKSTFATPLFDAIELSKPAGALWVDVLAKGELWKTANIVTLDA